MRQVTSDEPEREQDNDWYVLVVHDKETNRETVQIVHGDPGSVPEPNQKIGPRSHRDASDIAKGFSEGFD